MDKLDNVGYRREAITIKSDQEPAMLALRTAVAAKRIGTTTPIDSLVRELQCNGAAEQAVRRWQGQLRAIRSHFDENMGMKLPVAHPLMGWLVL